MRHLIPIGALLWIITGCTFQPVIRETPSNFNKLLTEANAPVLLQQEVTLEAISEQTARLTEIKSLLTELNEGKSSCTPAGPTDTKDLTPAPDPAPISAGVRLQFWTATWCGYCPAAKVEAKVIADELGVELEEVDFDKYASQRSKCKVDRIPTLCIIHDGMTRKWLVGHRHRNDIRKAIEKVLKKEVVRIDDSRQPVHMGWNVEGDWTPTVYETERHLERKHGVSTDGMSHQQMLDLHDSLHGSAVQTRRVRIVNRGSYCPSGRCPR